MYKPFILFPVIVALASLFFYCLVSSVLEHETRQAEEDFELQIQAASWLLEL